MKKAASLAGYLSLALLALFLVACGGSETAIESDDPPPPPGDCATCPGNKKIPPPTTPLILMNSTSGVRSTRCNCSLTSRLCIF